MTVLAYFHNKFLNDIHPFADGNGRVCRIIMGAVLMQHQCPPVFTQIKSENDRKAYIETIISCERSNSDLPLVQFLAEGMTKYLQDKIDKENGSFS
ncbi:Fic family protein [Echinicola shivajiensis]|uniref:Fic family protein n=1 Tax=Echinicola shivajiensis TaxID=1035916 RepID=UPI001BFC4360